MKRINIQTGFHFREAYRFALEKVNERGIVYGMNLSEKILSTEDITKYNKILKSFYIGNPSPVVSPVEPCMAFKVSLLTDALGIPLISNSYRNDKTKQPTSIFRATAADSYKLSAMVAIIKRLGWNYIVVLSSSGRNGETLSKAFIKLVSRSKICTAKEVSLPAEPTITEYVDALRGIASVEAAGLVLFTDNRDSMGLAMAMKVLAMKTKYQILAMGGFTNYIEITKGNEDYLQGAISVEHSSEELKGFKDHFLALKLDQSDDVSKAFWENTFSCKFMLGANSSLQECTGKEKILPGLGYYPLTPVSSVINSVFALAHAIKSYIKWRCSIKMMDPPCFIKQLTYRPKKEEYFNHIREFLRNNSFSDFSLNFTDPITKHDPSTIKFDIFNYVKEGMQFVSKNVGSWTHRRNYDTATVNNKGDFQLYDGVLTLEVSSIRWRNYSGLVKSSCQLPCRNGEVKTPHPNWHVRQCCWSCEKCGANMVSVNNTCVDCGKDFNPDPRKRVCLALEVRHFRSDKQNTGAIWAYTGLSVFGIILTTVVLIMFRKHDGNIVIRSSAKELCYAMLIGIYLLYLMPLTFLAAPSTAVCSVRYLLPGIAFCMCYSPLFLKINRIHMVFINAQSTTVTRLLASQNSQLFMVACFVSMQLLLGIVWVVSEIPQPVKSYYKTASYVIYSCSNEALPLVLNLVLSVGLMSCCTWYAFKTRNFPKNYNESRYIGFTMYISCICWAIFLPAYFHSSSGDSHMHEHLTCVLVLVVAFVNLIGLFGQRMQMLLMPTKCQRQRHFSKLSGQEGNLNQLQMLRSSLKNVTLSRADDRESNYDISLGI